jgi:hypothetical protein
MHIGARLAFQVVDCLSKHINRGAKLRVHADLQPSVTSDQEKIPVADLGMHLVAACPSEGNKHLAQLRFSPEHASRQLSLHVLEISRD